MTFARVIGLLVSSIVLGNMTAKMTKAGDTKEVADVNSRSKRHRSESQVRMNCIKIRQASG